MKTPFIAMALVLFGVPAEFVINAQTPPATAPAATQHADDAGITPNGAIGEVKVIDLAGKQLIVKTDAGSLVTVVLGDKTVYMRLAPGETTLTNATRITFSDLGEGDRVWARGKVAEDQKSVPASALIVMNKVDIAKKQEAERAEWRKRGVLGVITALKPETKEITISTSMLTGMQSLIIPVSDKVELRRYAPDSIKFADAGEAKFDELKVGDQLRALGERNPEGTAFTAEKVVTGSFITVSGIVTEVEAATGEVKINNLQSKQPLTIIVKQDAVLRKFPPLSEMGGMMMMGRPGGGGGEGRLTPSAGPGAGGARFNMQDILDRLPTIGIADVKVGDTIIVSSTKGVDPARLTAISFLSGADNLLTMLAARQPQSGRPNTPNPEAGLGTGIQFGIGLP